MLSNVSSTYFEELYVITATLTNISSLIVFIYLSNNNSQYYFTFTSISNNILFYKKIYLMETYRVLILLHSFFKTRKGDNTNEPTLYVVEFIISK